MYAQQNLIRPRTGCRRK